MKELPEYSAAYLALCNGHDREEIWIAFQGFIYDVKGSSFWKTGMHYHLHWAGQDLTQELEDAPHNAHVLLAFPRIGRLK
jgi:predicted heme/steroid binding protein